MASATRRVHDWRRSLALWILLALFSAIWRLSASSSAFCFGSGSRKTSCLICSCGAANDLCVDECCELSSVCYFWLSFGTSGCCTLFLCPFWLWGLFSLACALWGLAPSISSVSGTVLLPEVRAHAQNSGLFWSTPSPEAIMCPYARIVESPSPRLALSVSSYALDALKAASLSLLRHAGGFPHASLELWVILCDSRAEAHIRPDCFIELDIFRWLCSGI